MKKPAPKKHLPLWVSVVVIVGVLVMLIVVFFTRFAGHGKGQYTSENIADLQKFIDSGGTPMMPRAMIEKMGVKFPADYDERVKQKAARFGQGRPGMRAPMGRTPAGR